MPKLRDNQSTRYVKMLLMGDPGAGKTGGLTSLVKAGYKVRVFDFDNLLGSLVQFVMKECPEKADNVSFQTFTDKLKGTSAPIQMVGASAKVLPLADGIPTAFTRALGQLNHWKIDGEDLGPPSDWGEDTVLVVDSLTSMAAAAFRYAQGMNPGAKEQQTYFYSAQQLTLNTLALLCSEQMRTNVVVIAHVDYRTDQMNLTKGFPRAIGSAISTQIGAYFNAVLMAQSVGSGNGVKRTIRTNSTGIVDLKNPVVFKLGDTLPLETGLADFFQAVKSA